MTMSSLWYNFGGNVFANSINKRFSVNTLLSTAIVAAQPAKIVLDRRTISEAISKNVCSFSLNAV